MNGPSIQRLTVLSVVFHVTFFVAAFFAVKQSTHLVMPSPYIVNLVGHDIRTGGRVETRAAGQAEIPQSTKENRSAVNRPEKTKSVGKAEERHLSEQIEALRAKERIKKLAALRSDIISLKSSGEGKPVPSKGTAGKAGGTIIDDYYAKIRSDIWQNWDLPPSMADKNLEAIISFRVAKDGFVQSVRIEKSSGNGLFDRSVLRAIAKSSPLAPPPYELEIGVRFYP